MMRRGETLEEWRERMRAKGERDRGFLERERAAALAKPKRPEPKKAAAAPAPRRRRQVSARAASRPRSTVPSDCVGCGHPMRRRREQREGARLHMGRGLCTTCWATQKRRANGMRPAAEARQRGATRCAGCGRPLRSRRAAPSPGTLVRVGNSRCSTCYHGGR